MTDKPRIWIRNNRDLANFLDENGGIEEISVRGGAWEPFDSKNDVLPSQPTYGSTVSKCIDGDTIELKSGERVRIQGIDAYDTTNEVRINNQAIQYNKTTDEVKNLGNQAKQKCIDILLGNEVNLKQGTTKTDKYGRTLGEVRLTNNPEYNYNKDLIDSGIAVPYGESIINNQFREEKEETLRERNHRKGKEASKALRNFLGKKAISWGYDIGSGLLAVQAQTATALLPEETKSMIWDSQIGLAINPIKGKRELPDIDNPGNLIPGFQLNTDIPKEPMGAWEYANRQGFLTGDFLHSESSKLKRASEKINFEGVRFEDLETEEKEALARNAQFNYEVAKRGVRMGNSVIYNTVTSVQNSSIEGVQNAVIGGGLAYGLALATGGMSLTPLGVAITSIPLSIATAAVNTAISYDQKNAEFYNLIQDSITITNKGKVFFNPQMLKDIETYEKKARNNVFADNVVENLLDGFNTMNRSINQSLFDRGLRRIKKGKELTYFMNKAMDKYVEGNLKTEIPKNVLGKIINRVWGLTESDNYLINLAKGMGEEWTEDLQKPFVNKALQIFGLADKEDIDWFEAFRNLKDPEYLINLTASTMALNGVYSAMNKITKLNGSKAEGAGEEKKKAMDEKEKNFNKYKKETENNVNSNGDRAGFTTGRDKDGTGTRKSAHRQSVEDYYAEEAEEEIRQQEDEFAKGNDVYKKRSDQEIKEEAQKRAQEHADIFDEQEIDILYEQQQQSIKKQIKRQVDSIIFDKKIKEGIDKLRQRLKDQGFNDEDSAALSVAIYEMYKMKIFTTAENNQESVFETLKNTLDFDAFSSTAVEDIIKKIFFGNVEEDDIAGPDTQSTTDYSEGNPPPPDGSDEGPTAPAGGTKTKKTESSVEQRLTNLEKGQQEIIKQLKLSDEKFDKVLDILSKFTINKPDTTNQGPVGPTNETTGKKNEDYDNSKFYSEDGKKLGPKSFGEMVKNLFKFDTYEYWYKKVPALADKFLKNVSAANKKAISKMTHFFMLEVTNDDPAHKAARAIAKLGKDHKYDVWNLTNRRNPDLNNFWLTEDGNIAMNLSNELLALIPNGLENKDLIQTLIPSGILTDSQYEVFLQLAEIQKNMNLLLAKKDEKGKKITEENPLFKEMLAEKEALIKQSEEQEPENNNLRAAANLLNPYQGTLVYFLKAKSLIEYMPNATREDIDNLNRFLVGMITGVGNKEDVAALISAKATNSTFHRLAIKSYDEKSINEFYKYLKDNGDDGGAAITNNNKSVKENENKKENNAKGNVTENKSDQQSSEDVTNKSVNSNESVQREVKSDNSGRNTPVNDSLNKEDLQKELKKNEEQLEKEKEIRERNEFEMKNLNNTIVRYKKTEPGFVDQLEAEFEQIKKYNEIINQHIREREAEIKTLKNKIKFYKEPPTTSQTTANSITNVNTPVPAAPKSTTSNKPKEGETVKYRQMSQEELKKKITAEKRLKEIDKDIATETTKLDEMKEKEDLYKIKIDESTKYILTDEDEDYYEPEPGVIIRLDEDGEPILKSLRFFSEETRAQGKKVQQLATEKWELENYLKSLQEKPAETTINPIFTPKPFVPNTMSSKNATKIAQSYGSSIKSDTLVKQDVKGQVLKQELDMLENNIKVEKDPKVKKKMEARILFLKNEIETIKEDIAKIKEEFNTLFKQEQEKAETPETFKTIRMTYRGASFNVDISSANPLYNNIIDKSTVDYTTYQAVKAQIEKNKNPFQEDVEWDKLNSVDNTLQSIIANYLGNTARMSHEQISQVTQVLLREMNKTSLPKANLFKYMQTIIPQIINNIERLQNKVDYSLNLMKPEDTALYLKNQLYNLQGLKEQLQDIFTSIDPANFRQTVSKLSVAILRNQQYELLRMKGGKRNNTVYKGNFNYMFPKIAQKRIAVVQLLADLIKTSFNRNSKDSKTGPYEINGYPIDSVSDEQLTKLINSPILNILVDTILDKLILNDYADYLSKDYNTIREWLLNKDTFLKWNTKDASKLEETDKYWKNIAEGEGAEEAVNDSQFQEDIMKNLPDEFWEGLPETIRQFLEQNEGLFEDVNLEEDKGSAYSFGSVYNWNNYTTDSLAEQVHQMDADDTARDIQNDFGLNDTTESSGLLGELHELNAERVDEKGNKQGKGIEATLTLRDLLFYYAEKLDSDEKDQYQKERDKSTFMELKNILEEVTFKDDEESHKFLIDYLHRLSYEIALDLAVTGKYEEAGGIADLKGGVGEGDASGIFRGENIESLTSESRQTGYLVRNQIKAKIMKKQTETLGRINYLKDSLKSESNKKEIKAKIEKEQKEYDRLDNLLKFYPSRKQLDINQKTKYYYLLKQVYSAIGNELVSNYAGGGLAPMMYRINAIVAKMLQTEVKNQANITSKARGPNHSHLNSQNIYLNSLIQSLKTANEKEIETGLFYKRDRTMGKANYSHIVLKDKLKSLYNKMNNSEMDLFGNRESKKPVWDIVNKLRGVEYLNPAQRNNIVYALKEEFGDSGVLLLRSTIDKIYEELRARYPANELHKLNHKAVDAVIAKVLETKLMTILDSRVDLLNDLLSPNTQTKGLTTTNQGANTTSSTVVGKQSVETYIHETAHSMLNMMFEGAQNGSTYDQFLIDELKRLLQPLGMWNEEANYPTLKGIEYMADQAIHFAARPGSEILEKTRNFAVPVLVKKLKDGLLEVKDNWGKAVNFDENAYEFFNKMYGVTPVTVRETDLFNKADTKNLYVDQRQGEYDKELLDYLGRLTGSENKIKDAKIVLDVIFTKLSNLTRQDKVDIFKDFLSKSNTLDKDTFAKDEDFYKAVGKFFYDSIRKLHEVNNSQVRFDLQRLNRTNFFIDKDNYENNRDIFGLMFYNYIRNESQAIKEFKDIGVKRAAGTLNAKDLNIIDMLLTLKDINVKNNYRTFFSTVEGADWNEITKNAAKTDKTPTEQDYKENRGTKETKKKEKAFRNKSWAQFGKGLVYTMMDEIETISQGAARLLKQFEASLKLFTRDEENAIVALFAKTERNLSKDELKDLDFALKRGDLAKITELARKGNFEKELADVKKIINNFHYDGYFPVEIKMNDVEWFYTQNFEGVKKSGTKTADRFLTISQDKITPEMNTHLQPAVHGLINWIKYKKKQEVFKAQFKIGENEEYDRDDVIKKAVIEQMKKERGEGADIDEADVNAIVYLFNQVLSPGYKGNAIGTLNNLKVALFVNSLGNAINQVSEIIGTGRTEGLFTMLKALFKVATFQQRIKASVYLESQVKDLMGMKGTWSSRMAGFVSKWTGVEGVDMVGKSVRMNAIYENMMRDYKKDPKAFKEKYGEKFFLGDEEIIKQFMDEMKTLSTANKKEADALLIERAFSSRVAQAIIMELSETQNTFASSKTRAQMEHPIAELGAYSLKNYIIKYYNSIWRQIQNHRDAGEWEKVVGDILGAIFYSILSGLAVDYIKDLILGVPKRVKEDIVDKIVNNFFIVGPTKKTYEIIKSFGFSNSGIVFVDLGNIFWKSVFSKQGRKNWKRKGTRFIKDNALIPLIPFGKDLQKEIKAGRI
jgi:endonuclease YncB( thermonuclease family)